MIECTRDDCTSLCSFHPKEVVVGVCALCLNEKLLVLASKLENSNNSNLKEKTKRDQAYKSFLTEKKNGNQEHHSRIHYLPKIFALSSLLSRLDVRHGRKFEESLDSTDYASTCSREDSFISIKFENNGVASWEKGATVPKVSLKHCDVSWSRSSSKEGKGGAKVAVIEHAKPRLQLRWRKRIGHVFHLIRLKRPNKASVCHVGTKLEGVKVRHGHGWIRSLTKRKTKE